MIRVLSHAYKCIQRLGYLKQVITRTVGSSTSSLDILGTDLIRSVQARVSLPASPDVLDYVISRLTDGKYRTQRSEAKALASSRNHDAILSIEIQDAYLSDRRLASRTGKLIKEDFRFYPYYAVNLGFVRKGTYSPMVRAVAFLSLMQDVERGSLTNYDPMHNPFILSEEQRIFLLYLLLEADADVIRPLWGVLLETQGSFTERDGGFALVPIFSDIVRNANSHTPSLEEREKVQRLREIGEKIERWKGKPYTGGGAHIHNIRPRLEPFCDIGILTKSDPYKYTYQYSEQGEQFVQNVLAVPTIDDFLGNHFFGAVSQFLGINTKKITDERTILSHLYKASIRIKSSLGYSPIVDLGLLASIQAIKEREGYFELDGLKKMLVRYHQDHSKVLRFNVDRMGNLSYVKFLEPPPGV